MSQCIAVNAERAGGEGPVPAMFLKGRRHIFLLQRPDRLREAYSPFLHFGDQPLQAALHHPPPWRPYRPADDGSEEARFYHTLPEPTEFTTLAVRKLR